MVNNVDPGFCEDDVASIFKSARGLTKTKIISKGEHITAMLQFMVRFFFFYEGRGGEGGREGGEGGRGGREGERGEGGGGEGGRREGGEGEEREGGREGGEGREGGG